jgi:carboxypeptidase Taq
MTAYQTLEARFRKSALLGEAEAFLGWDASVLMPPGSAESRGEQMAALRLAQHELISASDMDDLLSEAEQRPLNDPWQSANLHEMRRAWIHQAAVSPSLVEARSRANSMCETVWRDARANNDFAAVLPYMEETVRLAIEVGQAKAERLGKSLYDALIDEYEPDGSTEEITAVFDDLSAFLPDFANRVIERQAQLPATPLTGPFPIEQQEALGLRLMEAIGFDFNQGRLDVSLHPFSGGTPEDSRITTRYIEDDFLPALMGIVHETGHALYEAGLPKDWRRQPVGTARGMAIHESQSLLMEMQTARSREYFNFSGTLIRSAFDQAGPEWSDDNLYRLTTKVERGFIRVDADEVTYPLHVILRFRLEQAVLSGDLLLADLPGAWNDGLEQLLGIRPRDDRLGCMQDIHWFDGIWGYFPTYTLGAMAAAQFFDAAKRANPDLLTFVGQGDFSPLLSWLKENIHSQASLHSTQGLLQAVTGKPLDTEIFKQHLKQRYLPDA